MEGEQEIITTADVGTIKVGTIELDPKELAAQQEAKKQMETEALKVSLHQISGKFKEHFFAAPENISKAQQFTIVIEPGAGFQFEGKDL